MSLRINTNIAALNAHRQQSLSQSATAMLSQANQSSQGVLSLLR